MPVLDSHIHFWKYSTSNPEFDWIGTGMERIQKSFLPQDLITTEGLNATEFGCIAVQAAQTWQETVFLMDLATKYNFIKGVVGWIDLLNLSPNQTFDFSKTLKGFRHIIQAEKAGFMLQEKFIQSLKIIGMHGYTFDILIKNEQINEAFEMVKKCPNQKFVIDHIAKPDIKNKDIKAWKEHISMFSSLENVFCKVSGMVTEADWHHWKQQDFRAYLDTIFEVFGTKRIMYGSDWPVCLVAGEYRQIHKVATDYISKLTQNEKECIMYRNAEAFYLSGF